MLSTFHWNRIVPNVSSPVDSTTQHTTIQQPLGRHGHTMVNYKNKLYLFGGHNGSTSSNDLYIYDIENNSWIEANTQGISPAPRYLHSAAVINDTMYIFGGARWLDTTNDLHLLNLETLTWTQPETKGTIPEILCSHSAFAKGDKLIIFGGLATRKMKFSNDVYSLDTRDFTWTREDTSGYSIPKKGYKASALVGNSLYVFSRTLFPVGLETHILDLNSMTWVQVATNGPYPELECFTACAIGTTIVVCGGKELSSPYSGNSRAVNDVFSLCSRTLSWSLLSSTLSPSPTDGFPARYGHSACTSNGKMYVFGGRSGYPKNLDDLFSFSWHQTVPSLIDLCLTKIVDQTPSDPHSLSPYLFSLSALPEDLFLLVFQRMAQHRKLTLSTLSLFLKNPSFLSCVTFSLSDCGNVVDDDWLHTIAQISSAHNQRWEILDISNCKLVSNKGLRKLTGLPNLKTLLADADSKITYEGVKMFKDHLPNVDVVLCRQSTPLYKVS